MKTLLLFITVAMLSSGALPTPPSTPYNVGDVVKPFRLKNIDGQMNGPADYANAKGFVVIFTCNHCPYAKAYEDRIIALHKEFAGQGYPVLAINPNDASRKPEDSYDNMKVRAKEKGFPFAYLHDETQEIAKRFGAAYTPQVFILNKKGAELILAYTGAIDSNPMNASEVDTRYAADAIKSLLAGNMPSPGTTKGVGCRIKWKAD